MLPTKLNDNNYKVLLYVFGIMWYLHQPTGQCEAANQYAEQLRDTIRHSIPKGRLAAFFAEPIQVSSKYTSVSFSGEFKYFTGINFFSVSHNVHNYW